jgi:hypothetical protein
MELQIPVHRPDDSFPSPSGASISKRGSQKQLYTFEPKNHLNDDQKNKSLSSIGSTNQRTKKDPKFETLNKDAFDDGMTTETTKKLKMNTPIRE